MKKFTLLFITFSALLSQSYTIEISTAKKKGKEKTMTVYVNKNHVYIVKKGEAILYDFEENKAYNVFQSTKTRKFIDKAFESLIKTKAKKKDKTLNTIVGDFKKSGKEESTTHAGREAVAQSYETSGILKSSVRVTIAKKSLKMNPRIRAFINRLLMGDVRLPKHSDDDLILKYESKTQNLGSKTKTTNQITAIKKSQKKIKKVSKYKLI